MDPQNALENAAHSMKLAEDWLGIPQVSIILTIYGALPVWMRGREVSLLWNALARHTMMALHSSVEPSQHHFTSTVAKLRVKGEGGRRGYYSF